jgi:hypothetical protein
MFETMEKRFIAFLIGCIGSRLLLVLIAKNIDNGLLPHLGYLSILPAIGFMYIYLTGSRKTGLEVSGEKIWWNNVRPIHSLLYFMFAYSAIMKKSYSWIFLLIDVVFGLVMFSRNHYRFISSYFLRA